MCKHIYVNIYVKCLCTHVYKDIKVGAMLFT